MSSKLQDIGERFEEIKKRLRSAGQDRSLVNKLADAFIKDIERANRDPLVTEVEQQIYAQVIRYMREHVIRTAYPEIQEKEDFITGAGDVGYEEHKEDKEQEDRDTGAGVLQDNTTDAGGRGIRDVFSYTDHFQNQLDIPSPPCYGPPIPDNKESGTTEGPFTLQDFLPGSGSPASEVPKEEGLPGIGEAASEVPRDEGEKVIRPSRETMRGPKKEEEPDLIGLMTKLIEVAEET